MRQGKVVLRPMIKREDRVDYILAGVCNYFKLPLSDIKKIRYGDRAIPKKIAIKMLCDIADVPRPYIADVFGISKNAVDISVRGITNDLDRHSYGNTELKNTYKQILQRLDL